MKILYDHQIFEMQRFGGISRYYFELLDYFEKNNGIQWEMPIQYSGNEYLRNMNLFRHMPAHPHIPTHPFTGFMFGWKFRGKGLLYRVNNKFFGEPIVKQPETNKAASIKKIIEGDFDIFHPTYYDDYFLDYIGEKPFVLTVYDLIHQLFPEFLLYEKPDKTAVMLGKAKKIFAISENTKRDLVNIFNIDENKIVVTLLANSLNPNATGVSAEFKKKLPARFLLFVGNRTGYKNFMFFTQVFAALASAEKDLHVVCTGPVFSDQELFFFRENGVTDRLHHTYVEDNELTYLYKNAVAFIFPSMYEGFGLPILEAFSCGCPVLVSNTSSMIEVGKDAVIYFEPKNAASMIGAIKTALHNKGLRSEKIQEGFQQLQNFSWEKTAQKTKEVYEEIVLGQPSKVSNH